MKIKIVYRDGRKYDNQYFDITAEEADLWIIGDYEDRLSKAPDCEKANVKKRTIDEIVNEHNRQEERDNKAFMRSTTRVDNIDLIPDENTLSPLELLLAQEQKAQFEEMKAYLYSKLTKTQMRRFEMRLEGLTLEQIAKAEGVHFTAIKQSLDQIDAKIKKYLLNTL